MFANEWKAEFFFKNSGRHMNVLCTFETVPFRFCPLGEGLGLGLDWKDQKDKSHESNKSR